MWGEVEEGRGGEGRKSVTVSFLCGFCVEEESHIMHTRTHTLPQGISFTQFNNFCQLLNSLDDFGVAMMMFTIAGTSVTQEEFARAAKVCIGTPLDSSVISTVFHIFDVDGKQSPLSNTHTYTPSQGVHTT